MPHEATQHTAYLWTPASLLHDTGTHVENLKRAEVLHPEKIRSALPPHVTYPDPRDHDALSWVKTVHPREYIDWVERVCTSGGGLLDEGDTHVCPTSMQAALGAVDAALVAADEVMTGAVRNAFCAVRPPGHHALIDRAMGFCIFATISILARYLQRQHQMKKVAIVDFDVHHGNGTQDVFYEDPSVFVVSMQQYPLWPMSGLPDETGTGDGDGCTVNIAVAPGTSEDAQLAMFEEIALPALRQFAPEVLLISAGFDAHRDDPLADLNLTEAGYEQMTRQLMDIGAEYCADRVISLLEGGYQLEHLRSCVIAHVNTLANYRNPGLPSQ